MSEQNTPDVENVEQVEATAPERTDVVDGAAEQPAAQPPERTRLVAPAAASRSSGRTTAMT